MKSDVFCSLSMPGNANYKRYMQCNCHMKFIVNVQSALEAKHLKCFFFIPFMEV